MNLKNEILLIKMEAVAVLLGSNCDNSHQTVVEFRAPYLARIRALREANK